MFAGAFRLWMEDKTGVSRIHLTIIITISAPIAQLVLVRHACRVWDRHVLVGYRPILFKTVVVQPILLLGIIIIYLQLQRPVLWRYYYLLVFRVRMENVWVLLLFFNTSFFVRTRQIMPTWNCYESMRTSFRRSTVFGVFWVYLYSWRPCSCILLSINQIVLTSIFHLHALFCGTHLILSSTHL